MLRQLRSILSGLLAVVLLCGPAAVRAQGLTDSGQELPGVWAGGASWADRDNDGDLDLAIHGETVDAAGRPARIARLFDNDAGLLREAVAAEAQLVGVGNGDAAWADYDGDGDLDLAVAGWDSTGQESLRLYVNDGGVLALDPNQRDDQGAATLRGVRYAALAWADHDGDGDLDLLVTGMEANGTSLTILYRNLDGVLQADQTNSESLVSLHNGDLAWADYDNDGDLDLAVSGENVTTSGGLRSVTELYRNDPAGTLTLDGTVGLTPKVHGGGLAWADYDGDGNLDLATSGIDDGWTTSISLYRNRPAGFLSPASLGLIPSWRLAGDLAWIDFDADGDADLALSGRTSTSVYHAAVLANTRGAFSVAWSDSLAAALAGGRAAWGDYDGDGRPDLVLTGVDAAGVRRTRLLQNAGGAVNDRPTPPVSLNPASVTSRRVLFSWPPGTDAQGANLTYNLRVGTRPGGGDVLSGTVAPGPGNTGFKNAKALERSLPRDTYYWSVQTVDAAHARSEWSQEDVLNVEQFASSDQRLRDLSEAAMAWGDYDADGDLDLVLTGQNRSGEAQSLLYANDDGLLTAVPDAGLTPMRNGDAAWGDYDGDGDLDLLLTGEDTFQNRRTYLYAAVPQGTGTGFTLAGRFPELSRGSAEWGDFDNDGDLDLALMGQSDEVAGGVQQSYTLLFANDGKGNFADTEQGLPGLNNGELAAADVDGDGDLDLAATGSTTDGSRRLDLYLNEGGRLTDAGLGLDGLESSDLAWGDWDGDGDPDLAAGGISSTGVHTVLYGNDHGLLTPIPGIELPGIRGGDLAWGDYDNDRDLDLVVAGNDGTRPILRLFENTGAGLEEDRVRLLQGIDFCAVSLADPEGDGDLDLFTAGRDSIFAPRTTVNDNLESQFNANRAPAAPTGLAAADSGNAVTLSWLPAADDGEDSPASLTYNLRVGTTPEGNDVLSGNAVLGPGNAGARQSHRLQELASGTYYWSAQAVDDGLARSAWSADQRFVVDTVSPRVSGVTLNQDSLGIGQTLTAALTLFDEHSGVDPRVEPEVVAVLGGQEYALTPLQFTGAAWSGALVIAAGLPAGTAELVVRGAVDAKGNPLEPFSLSPAFVVDTTLPAVAGSAPANGQTDVPVDLDEISVTFSEPLDPGGVNSHTFELELGSQILTQVPAPQYDAATNTVRFRPISGVLQAGSEYKIEISASIQDLAGNRPANAIALTFTTRVPRLLSTWPVDGDSLVAGTQPLTATFDAPLLASALDDEGVVRLIRDGRPVPLRSPPAYDAQAHGLTFEPAEGLKPGSRYEVILSGALTGPLGVQRTGDLSWSFVTATPELASWEPADTTVVDADQFRAVFTGPIDVDLLSAATVQVIREDEAQTVSNLLFDTQARTLTFEVAEGLRPGTRYRVLLSGLLGGPVRVARGGDYGWEFQTPVPQVVDLLPAADSEEVNPATAVISAVFDQPLDGPALLATGAATVLAGGTELDLADLEYNPETRTVRLEVAAGLRTGTAYEVRLTAAAGGPLRQIDYLWRFRTAVPRLVSVVPAVDATGVAVDLPEALVQFTVPVDEDQAVPANFALLREGLSESLRNGDPDHRGSGQYALAPAAGWQVGSRYTVQISSAVAGPLGAGQPLSWSFATAVPETLAVIPAAGDTAVSSRTDAVSARFSAPIDPVALRATGNVQLLQEGRAIDIEGVALDPQTATVTFSARDGLRPGTAYQVRLAAALGGPLRQSQGDYLWGFATRVPVPIAVAPTAGETVSAGRRRLQVTFSDAVDPDQITPANLRLSESGVPVTLAASEFLYDEATHTVSYPAVALAPGTRYQAAVSARLSGPQGSGLADREWSFQTLSPRVITTFPQSGEDGVSTSIPALQVAFSGAVARQDAAGFRMEARTLGDSATAWSLESIESPSLRDSSGAVLLSFPLARRLRPFTEYRVTVLPGVFGVLADTGFAWTFRTAGALSEPAQGGTVANADRSVELYFPPRALEADADEVVIRRLAEDEVAAKPASAESLLTRISSAYEVRAGIGPLHKPATLIMRYTEPELETRDAARLAIFRRGQGNWDRIGGSVDPAARQVRTAVDTLGVFALFEDLSTPVGSARFEELDCQPRAFSPTGSQGKAETDISFVLTAPDEVTVRVYNLTGRLERVLASARPMAPGRISLAWDGRDEDRDEVSSGLYIVVVSSGSTQREKTVAVVR